MSNDSYLDPYRDAVDDHGPGFEATLWANQRTQRVRFEVFAQMCYFGGKRVLDAGCGGGDLAAFLIERGIDYGRYIGLDGLPEVIDTARGRGLPNAEFHVGDFVDEPTLLKTANPQIITISGSLNTMGHDIAMDVLRSAWSAASETLLFNFLSDRARHGAPDQDHPARRLPTTRLLDWALSQTSDVRFRQDYFRNGHDATILMRKTG